MNLRLTDDEIIRDYIIPAREWVTKGRASPGKSSESAFARENELRQAIGLAHASGNENVVGTIQAAQKAALFTAASAGTMNHALAFTQRSLQVGDQLAVTFTITLS